MRVERGSKGCHCGEPKLRAEGVARSVAISVHETAPPGLLRRFALGKESTQEWLKFCTKLGIILAKTRVERRLCFNDHTHCDS